MVKGGSKIKVSNFGALQPDRATVMKAKRSGELRNPHNWPFADSERGRGKDVSPPPVILSYLNAKEK